ncbi:MAG: ATP-binding protein [Rhodanobacteraceae bacterium]|nr:MAG: ATP-binding protein [Rhodanobacteraceae bacterium]
MNLKPWREIAVPHEDVRKGTFVQAEFAADISRVHDGSASDEYQQPELFFQRTFITEGMAALLTSVAKRLTHGAGDPVIQLQTAFGGGKTHTLLAVMHMVAGVPAAKLVGLPAILKAAHIDAVPKATVVVLDGINLSPSKPRKVQGHTLRTLWGELAWQLGGEAAYAEVAEADATGTSPGKVALGALLKAHSPCVILIDELVAYLRQFEEGKSYTGGTFDSNLSFIQALTEAMKAAPNAVSLVSLPESDTEGGSAHGIHTLRTLEHFFGRVQAIWKPVSTEESFEIVRRRLFSEIRDPDAANAVCDAFAKAYVEHADSLPGETQEARYRDRLRAAYPIHPEVFARLYEDWSSLPNFQRTRGVLKLMARVIHRLWQDNNQDALLLPGSLPLYDSEVATELTNYLGQGWDPVIEHDVDGEHSEPAELDAREPRFGAVQACRRAARCIFLGSAPGSVNQTARGVETNRVLLGCLQPGQQPHVYRDALGRLETRLTYLNKGNDRWWLDVRPNLRREMEERKRRFEAAEVTDEIRGALRRVMGSTTFNVHVFTPAADVPDDWSIRLVVLTPDQAWTRSGANPARDAAAAILRLRGEQPRMKQNRLLFLAADGDQVRHLRDTVRALLAWRSIEADAKELRMTLDNLQQRQVAQYKDKTAESVLRIVREAFKWLVAPSQVIDHHGKPSDIEWESFALNPAAPGLGKEIERVLRENELVISEWAPVHLHNLLTKWFWRDGVSDANAQDVWEKSCTYLYFPRLAGSSVMQATIAAGATSRDFFGLASDRNDDAYRGFSFGKSAAIFMDALLLIEPKAAAAYAARMQPAYAPTSVGGESMRGSAGVPGLTNSGAAITVGATSTAGGFPPRPRRYFATVELDPVRAAVEFSKIQNELIGLFTANPSSRVTIKVDIEVSDNHGFDETTVRAAKENGKTLGVKSSGFE